MKLQHHKFVYLYGVAINMQRIIMNIKNANIVLPLLFCLAFTASIVANDKTKMFPKTETGYTKYIIDVPKTSNDFDHKVEVIIGQDVMSDCNTKTVIANIEHRVLQGWGYSYIYVTSDTKSTTASTKMRCREPKKKRFIQVRNKTLLMRYNSKLPIVVYVPNHLAVKYRIWSASSNSSGAIKD